MSQTLAMSHALQSRFDTIGCIPKTISSRFKIWFVFAAVVVGFSPNLFAQFELPIDTKPGTTGFRWQVSSPILEMQLDRFPPTDKPWLAIKDPSIVRYQENWHLFCTIRRGGDQDGRIRIGYTKFADWDSAQEAEWSLLDLTLGYHGAPQVFYFEPQKKWYLIYQAEDSKRDLKYGPCYSVNDDLTDPKGWSRPEPLYAVPPGTNAGLDFWVICDDTNAHLFFTTLNGKMWRAETALGQFPDQGWSKPKVVLEGDIFEASHTYKIAGQNRFVTFVEAQDHKAKSPGRRYFKAYQAEALDGRWTALADTRSNPFVSPMNVQNQDESWATSYSHGEFIREGYDQKLEVDLNRLQMLFQGIDDAGRTGRNYGEIPWKLGLLNLQSIQSKTEGGDQ